MSIVSSLSKKMIVAGLFLALCGFGQAAWLTGESHADIITAAQLNDYSSQVKVTMSGFAYQRATRLYTGKLKLHKDKSAALKGSLVVVLHDLPEGVVQTNADGYIDGAPYTYIAEGLSDDAAVTVPLTFSNPSNLRITLTPTVHQLINGSVNAEAVRAWSEPFTIAALPDTQIYAEDELIEFDKQIEWVLANRSTLAFVTHLGDVVDNGTDTDQWAYAMNALAPLLEQSELPFSIVRGNHDDPTFFLNHIPEALMQSKPWFIAADPTGLTQAQVFRVGNACILHLGFQKDPTQDELTWANELLARPELAGLPVIVSTHDYIDGSGRSWTGRYMWNDFVKDNPMVFMVLNGHTHTEYAVINHNEANRPVYQMLSDYQDRNMGGNGLMRLITIDPAQGKIFVKTFSPYFREDEDAPADLNYFETDADSEFEYDVNIRERLAYDTTYDFGDEPPAPPLPELNDMPADLHYSHIFQNRRPLVGTGTAYEGTVDVQINENNANLNYGGEATLTTDMDDNGSRVHAFLRFDDIIGTGTGQIPPGSIIRSAKLVFSATSSTKGMVKMHRMLIPWGEHSTWMDFTPADESGQPAWEDIDYFNYDTGKYEWVTLHVMVGGGVQADDLEAMSETDAVFTMPKPVPVPFVLQPSGYGTMYTPPSASGDAPIDLTVDLTKSVQAWVDGQVNYGWFFEPTSSDGWDFETAEGKQPPALLIEVEGAPLAQ